MSPFTSDKPVMAAREILISTGQRITGAPGTAAIRRTARIERLLLYLGAAFLAVENQLPAIQGYSVLFLLLLPLAGYAALFRQREIASVACHPVFLVSSAFILFGFLVEALHRNSDYQPLWRVAEVLIAAICIAALCRDRPGMLAVVSGCISGALVTSVLLFAAVYGAIGQAGVQSFAEASGTRAAVFSDTVLTENLNRMSFIAALGAALSLALVLTARSRGPKLLALGATTICVVGSMLPMSRGGVVTLSVLAACIWFMAGRSRGLAAFIMAGVITVTVILLPDVLVARLRFSALELGAITDPRVELYRAAWEHLPEYLLWGVGAGGFWGPWGLQSAFARAGDVIGAHNVFVQAALYWGAGSVVLLTAVVIMSWRCLAGPGGGDAYLLSVRVVALSLILRMAFVHDLHAKEFAIGLGFVIGFHAWRARQCRP